MDLLAAFLFLIVVLVVVYPWVQGRRERALSEKLGRARDPGEAASLVDSHMARSRHEKGFLTGVRERLWPFPD